MKVAIIPTLNELQLSTLGDFDLVEIPWCVDYYGYRRYYTRRSRDDKRYVILDNGAGISASPVSEDSIREVSRYIQPAEVVAPDMRGKGAQSFELTAKFLLPIATALLKGADLTYKVMITPQGKDRKEWEVMYIKLIRLIRTLELSEYAVIGVPKWLTWDGDDQFNRVDILSSMGKVATDIPHHLLGGGRFLLQEINAARHVECIRGIDTSAPVALAAQDIPLLEDTELVRSTTFNLRSHLPSVDLARRNIELLMSVARGETEEKKVVQKASSGNVPSSKQEDKPRTAAPHTPTKGRSEGTKEASKE